MDELKEYNQHIDMSWMNICQDIQKEEEHSYYHVKEYEFVKEAEFGEKSI